MLADSNIRRVAKENRLGVLLMTDTATRGHDSTTKTIISNFEFDKGAGRILDDILAQTAKHTGHAGWRYAPLCPLGHSAKIGIA